MKISKSKRQLAQLLIESGVTQFPEGANWAAQCRKGEVSFWGEKPTKEPGCEWCGGDYLGHSASVTAPRKIPNWHQTALGRDDFDQIVAETVVVSEPDADGWVEWSGGACPVDDGVCVEIRRESEVRIVRNPETINWVHYGTARDIIAYRLHNPEQAKTEFCESVTRSIPDPEPKPTIEQLAADYRNRKDYADRKQEEADAAKADAEAKLAELVAAGEAIGLVVSVTKKPVYTGKFHSAKHGDKPSDLDMICDGCGKRFGTHVGFDCSP